MKLDLKDIPAKLSDLLEKTAPYRVPLFLVLVVAAYAFLLLQINQLSNAQPSQDDINTQLSGIRPPTIDKKVVQQLLDLQDNNVNVQSLFDQARHNPFQE